MYCPNCGKLVTDGLKFCTNCGASLAASTPSGKTIKIKCQSCGGAMELDDDRPVMMCPFCGSKELIIENDAVTIERIRSKAYKDVALDRNQVEKDIAIHKADVMRDVELKRIKLERAEAKDEQRKRQREIARAFSRTPTAWIIKGLMVFFAICAMLAFMVEDTVPGTIGIIQVALLGAAWLVGNGTIKVPHGVMTVLILLPVVLIGPYWSKATEPQRKAQEERNQRYEEERKQKEQAEAQRIEHLKSQTVEWPTTGYLSNLPEPEVLFGEIIFNSEESCEATLYNQTSSTYLHYIDQCKKAGFSKVYTENSMYYIAYNDELDRLRLDFDKDNENMSIEVEPPDTMTEIQWPRVGLAAELPTPQNLYGRIYSNSDNVFTVYISGITREQFNEYIAECVDAGYTEKPSQYENSYSATKPESKHLRLEYNEITTVMTISISTLF